jgi:mannosyltransferase
MSVTGMSVATARPVARPGADTARDRPSRDRLKTAVAIGIPTALAAALCLYDLSARSLWLDEAATVSIASQHGAAFGSALARDGGNMLGYYAVVHVLIGAFGKGAVVLRLPSVIGAVATVCVLCVLGLRLFGRRIAFGAGLLAAVSLPLVYWGQNARGYSLMVALIAGAFLALVIACQSEHPLGAWVAYGVLTVAAVYAGLEAVLVIPAQLPVLIRYRDRWRGFAVALAVVAACCAPLAVLALNRGSGQLFWVPAPSFETAKQVVQSLASTGLQPNFYTATGNPLLALTGIALVLAVGRTWSIVRGRGGWAAAWVPVLVLSWLVVPFVLALLESVAGQSIFQPRYLLVSLPAVALLLAWALLDRRVPVLIGLATLGVLIALRAAQIVPTYGVSPENWRAATAHVLSRTRAGDCVAFYPLDNRMPFQYYLGGAARAPSPILPAVPLTQARAYVEDYATLPTAQLSALRPRCTRVWLLTSHEGTIGGPPISRQNYTRLNALLAALRHEYPATSKESFGTAKTVTLTLFTGAA